MNLPSLIETKAQPNIDVAKSFGSFLAQGSARPWSLGRPEGGAMLPAGADFSQVMEGIYGESTAAAGKAFPGETGAESPRVALGEAGRPGATTMRRAEDMPTTDEATPLAVAPLASFLSADLATPSPEAPATTLYEKELPLRKVRPGLAGAEVRMDRMEAQPPRKGAAREVAFDRGVETAVRGEAAASASIRAGRGLRVEDMGLAGAGVRTRMEGSASSPVVGAADEATAESPSPVVQMSQGRAGVRVGAAVVEDRAGKQGLLGDSGRDGLQGPTVVGAKGVDPSGSSAGASSPARRPEGVQVAYPGASAPESSEARSPEGGHTAYSEDIADNDARGRLDVPLRKGLGDLAEVRMDRMEVQPPQKGAAREVAFDRGVETAVRGEAAANESIRAGRNIRVEDMGLAGAGVRTRMEGSASSPVVGAADEAAAESPSPVVQMSQGRAGVRVGAAVVEDRTGKQGLLGDSGRDGLQGSTVVGAKGVDPSGSSAGASSSARRPEGGQVAYPGASAPESSEARRPEGGHTAYSEDIDGNDARGRLEVPLRKRPGDLAEVRMDRMEAQPPRKGAAREVAFDRDVETAVRGESAVRGEAAANESIRAGRGLRVEDMGLAGAGVRMRMEGSASSPVVGAADEAVVESPSPVVQMSQGRAGVRVGAAVVEDRTGKQGLLGDSGRGGLQGSTAVGAKGVDPSGSSAGASSSVRRPEGGQVAYPGASAPESSETRRPEGGHTTYSEDIDGNDARGRLDVPLRKGPGGLAEVRMDRMEARPLEARKASRINNAATTNSFAAGDVLSARLERLVSSEATEGAVPYRSVLEQIREGMTEGFKDGGRVRITLHPESLGRVDMDIVVRQDRVDLIMRVDNNQVHQLLSSRIEDLKATLQGQGWQVNGVDVMLQKENNLHDGNNFAGMFSWRERMNRERSGDGMAGGRNGNRSARPMDGLVAAAEKTAGGMISGLSIFA